MESILLTGCNGFVGNVLKKKLVKKYKVYGFDIAKSTINFKHRNYKFFKKDLASKSVLELLKNTKIDIIIHLSAISTDKLFNLDPVGSFNNNLISTLNLLNFSNEKKCKNFIFASSEWVYGNDNGVKRLLESNLIDRNKVKSSYGISKLMGEDLIVNFYNNNKINNYTILRFGILFGPREKPSSAVEGLMMETKHDDVINISGSKKSGRTFIYMDDLITGLEKVIKKNITGIFNLCNDKLYTLEDIVKISNQLFGMKKKIIVSNKSKPVTRYNSNLKFKKYFKWKPRYDLKKSLKVLISKVKYV
ncbi:NAD(P)-dependent oxidoreductase [Candidatus Pelagibacter sp.]|nr:NAD(P)-dependent oxidoreductase [Candidatus Pelagibacter sp.]